MGSQFTAEASIEKAKHQIAVMEAYIRGEPIEWVDQGGTIWDSIENPSWLWNSTDYRVAPPKIVFNWASINKRYKFAALSRNKLCLCFFETKPFFANGWVSDRYYNDVDINLLDIKNVDKVNVADSLIERY